jgi:hypothetical protein
VQLVNVAPSSEHSNAAAGSLVNVKRALVLVVVAGGACVIVVCGASCRR